MDSLIGQLTFPTKTIQCEKGGDFRGRINYNHKLNEDGHKGSRFTN